MSGYLQRLVQTAAQPVQSVHPFVGSIFASSHDDQQSGIESEEICRGDCRPSPMRLLARSNFTTRRLFLSRHARPDGSSIREYRPIAPVSVVTPLQTEGEANALLFQQEQFAQSPHPSANIGRN